MLNECFLTCRRGLDRWYSTLIELKQDSKSLGAAKCVRVTLYFLRIITISEWLLFCTTGGREDQKRNLVIVDWYVVAKTVAVAMLVWLPEKYLTFGAFAASYLLLEMFVALANVVFLAPKLHAQPVSIERSLMLLLLNVIQLIATFALIYQAVLFVDPWRGIVFSFDVFGTVGRPSSYDYPTSDILVVIQIALDFLFLAIVVASFFSLRSERESNSSAN